MARQGNVTLEGVPDGNRHPFFFQLCVRQKNTNLYTSIFFFFSLHDGHIRIRITIHAHSQMCRITHDLRNISLILIYTY